MTNFNNIIVYIYRKKKIKGYIIYNKFQRNFLLFLKKKTNFKIRIIFT